MLDFHTLAEFSRTNCISICAFFVPANLLCTLLTIIFTVFDRPQKQIWLTAGIGSIFTALMALHVYTWFIIGVVMLPTYILLSLGVTCLIVNLVVITWGKYFPKLVNSHKFLAVSRQQ